MLRNTIILLIVGFFFFFTPYLSVKCDEAAHILCIHFALRNVFASLIKMT